MELNHKKIKQEYKQQTQPHGIFQIRNNQTGKILIGSSKNLRGTWNSYRFQLKMGASMNRNLQEDWNKFGAGAFSFEVLDELEPNDDPRYDYSDDLTLLEEMWIEKLQPFGDRGYNKPGQFKK